MDKWKTPPVFYTLAQIKYNHLPNLADHEKSLSLEFIDHGFPDFEQDSVNQLELKIMPDMEPVFTQKVISRWRFANPQKTECFILTDKSLTFIVSQYETFGLFKQTFLRGLDCLHRRLRLAYVETIGLRYLDGIIVDEGSSLNQFLRPEAKGPGIDIEEASLQNSYSERIYKLEHGVAVCRILVKHNGLPIAPDLEPLALELQPRFQESSGLCATLDNDYIYQKRIVCEGGNLPLDEVSERLDYAKKVVYQAFFKSVTATAVERWQK